MKSSTGITQQLLVQRNNYIYIYIYMDHSSKSLGSNHGGETRKESIMQVILLLQTYTKLTLEMDLLKVLW